MPTFLDWPSNHECIIRGRWRGVVRVNAQPRARVALSAALTMPPPDARVLEAGRVVLLEWPDMLSALVRALPLGRADFHGRALTLACNGDRIFHVRTGAVAVSASIVTPPSQRSPSIALRRCIGCGAALAPGTAAHYCSASCRVAAHRRRRSVDAGGPIAAAHDAVNAP